MKAVYTLNLEDFDFKIGLSRFHAYQLDFPIDLDPAFYKIELTSEGVVFYKLRGKHKVLVGERKVTLISGYKAVDLSKILEEVKE